MADGVRLAVDIYLPKPMAREAKLPTLYTATRYWRAAKGDPLSPTQMSWVAQGYAVVNADVRGTGASFGQWYIPYSPQEARDVGYLANWIARQAWSNGKVVMTGISYLGTTALMGPAYGEPAIKAVAPIFSDFDMYTDLIWPGGVPAVGLITKWGDLVHQLDMDVQPGGVRPVDGPQSEQWLAQAVKGHSENADFARAAYDISYKDQRLHEFDGLSIGDGGVYNLQARIERSGVPILGWGSWLDSGIAQGLLNRFMTWSNPQITIIGPWTHGAAANVDVFNPDDALEPAESTQDRMVFCFLNHFVRSTASRPISSHRKILFYFTMGQEEWHRTYVWPIPGAQQTTLYLEANHSLSRTKPTMQGRNVYHVDFEASAGAANRWATQAGGPRIDYGNRALEDRKLLTYTSAPLVHELDITGQPVITLRAASDRTDGNFFVYLEDVAPDGKVTYLTEGVLRARDRKVSTNKPPYDTTYPFHSFTAEDARPLVPGSAVSLVFPLEATSVLLRPGHRIRIAIAGADTASFSRIPAEGSATMSVFSGGLHPSRLELPVVPGPTWR
jgi:hypothetical protein